MALFCLATYLATFQKIGRFFPNHLVTLLIVTKSLAYYKVVYITIVKNLISNSGKTKRKTCLFFFIFFFQKNVNTKKSITQNIFELTLIKTKLLYLTFYCFLWRRNNCPKVKMPSNCNIDSFIFCYRQVQNFQILK